MPALENPRHEAFAQAYAVTGNAAESWRQSGGTGGNADVNGAEWLVKPGIKERVQEIRSMTAATCEKSKKDVARWLCGVIDRKEVATGAQLKAAEVLNRMNGWYEPDKIAVNGHGQTPEQKAANLFASPAAMAVIGDDMRELLQEFAKSECGRRMMTEILEA